MLWKSLSDKVPLEYQPKGSDRVTHVDISPSSEIGAVRAGEKLCSMVHAESSARVLALAAHILESSARAKF